MKLISNHFFSNYYLPIQVHVLLFCICVNLINLQCNASTLEYLNCNNNICYLTMQKAHQQNIPFNSKSESTEVPSINLEEEDDFFTTQYFPEVFFFDILPFQTEKIINEENSIECFHPELTVPPPKINSFESFC